MPIRRSSRLLRIERTEISGIPCFWADAPPPFTATLVFRVGRCDETLPTAGITHLAEHILMPASPPREVDRNARVEDVFAVFWATGNPTRALRFLEGLAGFIADPPVERLETERSILRAERGGGVGHPVPASAALRYGARGHGLIGFDEYGLHELSADAVAAWVAQYFTRENAVLWMTGEPPRELSLDLPAGTRKPPPAAEPLAELRFPLVHADGPADMVVVSCDAERSAPHSMASFVLLDRAWQQIRYDRGLAYDIASDFVVLTADVLHETIWIESLEHNVGEVRDALLGLFQEMAENGATEEELGREVERVREDLSEPASLPDFMHFLACEYLLGREDSPEAYLRRLEEVTPEATAEVWRPVLDRLLIAVPSEEHAPAGYELYPRASSHSVQGAVHRLFALPISRAARRSALILGADGITIRGPDDLPYTVRFDEVAAVMRWPDGTRTLWGIDGTHLHVDPEEWRKGRDVVAAIDAAVPDHLVVRVEPELVRRQEHVAEVAAAKLHRRWVVDDELKALPEELEEDEVVLTLAEANRGLRAGLLAVTDRRLLWLYRMFSERRLELRYDEIRDVSSNRGLLEASVTVDAGGERIKFDEIAPKERVGEIAELVRKRIG